jgi:hypothetical protein
MWYQGSSCDDVMRKMWLIRRRERQQQSERSKWDMKWLYVLQRFVTKLEWRKQQVIKVSRLNFPNQTRGYTWRFVWNNPRNKRCGWWLDFQSSRPWLSCDKKLVEENVRTILSLMGKLNNLQDRCTKSFYYLDIVSKFENLAQSFSNSKYYLFSLHYSRLQKICPLYFFLRVEWMRCHPHVTSAEVRCHPHVTSVKVKCQLHVRVPKYSLNACSHVMKQ